MNPNSSVNKPALEGAFADGVTIRGSVSFPVSVSGASGHQALAASYSNRSGTDLESLDTLARLGFTFALDDVDHVEMDFESLLSRGLAFVKVSADVFRHGLIAGEAVIPTDEIRLLFEDAGLQLIVHHISDEAGLDAALAQTVTFGQGNLFAKPKPVKADLLSDANRAA